jgi:hypothetical protein
MRFYQQKPPRFIIGEVYKLIDLSPHPKTGIFPHPKVGETSYQYGETFIIKVGTIIITEEENLYALHYLYRELTGKEAHILTSRLIKVKPSCRYRSF